MNVILVSVEYNSNAHPRYEYKFILQGINNKSEFVILTDVIFEEEIHNKVFLIDDFFEFYKKNINSSVGNCH